MNGLGVPLKFFSRVRTVTTLEICSGAPISLQQDKRRVFTQIWVVVLHLHTQCGSITVSSDLGRVTVRMICIVRCSTSLQPSGLVHSMSLLYYWTTWELSRTGPAPAIGSEFPVVYWIILSREAQTRRSSLGSLQVILAANRWTNRLNSWKVTTHYHDSMRTELADP